MSVVVLCGSLGATSAIWDGQLPVLAPHEVVRVEHPGHGGAPVERVETVGDLAQRVLERVDGPFSFVGLSLGGAVGMQLALDHPERIETLVLACTSAKFGEPELWRDRAATVRSEGVTAVVDAALARWFVGSPPAGFREMYLSTDPEGYARCCEALARWDARDALGAIQAPTLVVAGSKDPVSPPEAAELIASHVPGARLAVIEGAAHLANVERADDFNRLLETHL